LALLSLVFAQVTMVLFMRFHCFMGISESRINIASFLLLSRIFIAILSNVPLHTHAKN
jgi:hypothetical protein